MKAFFLALLLSVSLFANDTTLYRDEEIDLVIQVPAELQRTWNLSNSQTGLSLTVFNTDENDDDTYVLVVGKIPLLNVPGEEIVDIIPMLLDQFYEGCSDQETCYLADEVQYYIEKLTPSPEFTDRYRVYLYLEEVDETIRMDLNLFVRNGQSCLIMTGGLDCDTLDDLDDFSEKILNNTRFIEEA